MRTYFIALRAVYGLLTFAIAFGFSSTFSMAWASSNLPAQSCADATTGSYQVNEKYLRWLRDTKRKNHPTILLGEEFNELTLPYTDHGTPEPVTKFVSIGELGKARAELVSLSKEKPVVINRSPLLLGVFLPEAYFGPRSKSNFEFPSAEDVEREMDKRSYAVWEEQGIVLRTQGYRKEMMDRWLENNNRASGSSILYRSQTRSEFFLMEFKRAINIPQKKTAFQQLLEVAKQDMDYKIQTLRSTFTPVEPSSSGLRRSSKLRHMVTLKRYFDGISEYTSENAEFAESLLKESGVINETPFLFFSSDPSWSFYAAGLGRKLFAYRVDLRKLDPEYRNRIYIGVDSTTADPLASKIRFGVELVMPKHRQGDFDQILPALEPIGQINAPQLLPFVRNRRKEQPRMDIDLNGWYHDLDLELLNDFILSP